jgi:hypothetical protein
MSEQPLKDLFVLRLEMDTIEEEIRYLEEVLVTTSGPADHIVADLERNKDLLAELSEKYSKKVKKIEKNRLQAQKGML